MGTPPSQPGALFGCHPVVLATCTVERACIRVAVRPSRRRSPRRSPRVLTPQLRPMFSYVLGGQSRIEDYRMRRSRLPKVRNNSSQQEGLFLYHDCLRSPRRWMPTFDRDATFFHVERHRLTDGRVNDVRWPPEARDLVWHQKRDNNAARSATCRDRARDPFLRQPRDSARRPAIFLEREHEFAATAKGRPESDFSGTARTEPDVYVAGIVVRPKVLICALDVLKDLCGRHWL